MYLHREEISMDISRDLPNSLWKERLSWSETNTQLPTNKGTCGAMVAHQIPDLKVIRSSRVKFSLTFCSCFYSMWYTSRRSSMQDDVSKWPSAQRTNLWKSLQRASKSLGFKWQSRLCWKDLKEVRTSSTRSLSKGAMGWLTRDIGRTRNIWS